MWPPLSPAVRARHNAWYRPTARHSIFFPFLQYDQQVSRRRFDSAPRDDTSWQSYKVMFFVVNATTILIQPIIIFCDTTIYFYISLAGIYSDLSKYV